MTFPHPGLAERLEALRRRAVHSPRNPDVREVVRLRAGDACEYCLLPTIGRFHIEHIIPPGLWEKYQEGRLAGVPLRLGRGGPNHVDNYAWSCPFCNEAKAERVSYSIRRANTRFFDPRYDQWQDHFVFLPGSGYLFIVGATEVGRVTAGASGLRFNVGGLDGPLSARHVAILRGEYPPRWARVFYSL
jgi:hypothetical protein